MTEGLASVLAACWRVVVRLALFVMVPTLMAGFVAFKLSDVPLVSVCGGRSVVSAGSTLLAGPAGLLRTAGSFVADLRDHPEVYASPDAVRQDAEGTRDVLSTWWGSFARAVRGEPADPLVGRLAEAAKDEVADSVRSCLPCPEVSSGSDAPSSTALASDESTVTTTGDPKSVARAAIVAAGFPAAQVPTAMGVVGAESSYRPTAVLHYKGTRMLGLFQINERAHPDLMGLGDPFDPSVNARMAFKVWTQAGRKWTPWSTFTSGAYRSHMSAADQLSASVVQSGPGESNSTTSVSPSPSGQSAGQNSTGTMAGCAGAGTGGPTGGIVTWNTYVDNSDGNVLRGLDAIRRQAVAVGLQEVSASARRAAIRGELDGWGMVGDDTAQPIVFDEAKERLVSSGSKVVIPGDLRMDARSDGQRTNGTRWVVWATFDEVGSGVRWSMVNTHQIPTIDRGDRKVYATRLTAAVASKVKELSALGAVVQTGDMNATGDTGGVLAAAGLTDVSRTLGVIRSHDIDKVFVSGATPVAQRLLPKSGSDHAPRLVVMQPATQNVVDASGASGASAGIRVVRDPTTGVSYSVRMPSDPRRVKALEFMFAQLGEPYVWGAHGPNSWDCSGLVAGGWGAAGMHATPQTGAMVGEFAHVATPQPGDGLWHPGHIQAYVGTIGGKQIIIEAPRPGRNVIIRPQWGSVDAVLDPTRPVT